MAKGEDHQGALYGALDRAMRAAASLANPVAGMSRWTTFEASFGQIIGENVKALREEAGWTQAQLAEAMTRLGFDWKRITMAEAEAASRRVTYEELVGLAVLFGVPVVELLIPSEAPNDTTLLAWNTGDLTASTVLELLIGSGGALGRGGLAWRAAARAAGRPRGMKDWRPAADLWRTRRSSSGAQYGTDAPGKES